MAQWICLKVDAMYIVLAHMSSSGKESISAHTGNQTSPHGYCMHGCRVTASAHAANQTIFSGHCIHSTCLQSARIQPQASNRTHPNWLAQFQKATLT